MVKTPRSNAGGADSIPDQENKLPHGTWPINKCALKTHTHTHTKEAWLVELDGIILSHSRSSNVLVLILVLGKYLQIDFFFTQK